MSSRCRRHHWPQQRLRVHSIGGETTCIVCFVNLKTHLAAPCGHTIVRAALVLGADADMPLLPRAGAAVGAAPHGLRALLVGVCELVCTLLVSALSLSSRHSLVFSSARSTCRCYLVINPLPSGLLSSSACSTCRPANAGVYDMCMSLRRDNLPSQAHAHIYVCGGRYQQDNDAPPIYIYV